MKIIFLCSSLLLVASLYSDESLVKNVEKVNYNTVSIVNDPNNLEKSSGGTGIVINKKNKTYVLTNNHVVEGLKNKLFIFKVNEQSKLIVNTKVLAVSKKIDVAVLECAIDLSSCTKSTEFEFDNKCIKKGMDVFYYGDFAHWGKYGDLAVTRGILSYNTGEHLICQLTVLPGCSGGGMYDMNGKCIGMVAARFEFVGAQVIPINDIKDWANKNKLSWLFSD